MTQWNCGCTPAHFDMADLIAANHARQPDSSTGALSRMKTLGCVRTRWPFETATTGLLMERPYDLYGLIAAEYSVDLISRQQGPGRFVALRLR